MGLDVSHDAFHGAYSSFNRLRGAVAKAAGGSFPPHDDLSLDQSQWYWEGDIYSHTSHPGLSEFLMHSDCDGQIEPELLNDVAHDLEMLLPAVTLMGIGAGHIERDGGYGAVLERFITGCKAAAAAQEPLEFC